MYSDRKYISACLWMGVEGEKDYKGGTSKLWGLIKLFVALIMVMVQVYICQNHQSTHFREV